MNKNTGSVSRAGSTPKKLGSFELQVPLQQQDQIKQQPLPLQYQQELRT